MQKIKDFLKTTRGKIILVALPVIIVVLIVSVIIITSPEETGYRTIKVSELEGMAKVEHNEKIYDAYVDMVLKEGYSLSTENASYVRMLLDQDKYIKLEANSKVVFANLEGMNNNYTVINLEYGAITNEITQRLSEEDGYIIKTPNSVLAVKGTFFRVEVRENESGEIITDVYTYGGVVKSQRVLPTGEVVEEEVFIDGGYKASISMDTDDTIYVTESIEEGKEHVEQIALSEIPEADLVDMYVASLNNHEMYITTEEIWNIIEELEIEIEDYTSNRDGSEIPKYEYNDSDSEESDTTEDSSTENDSDEDSTIDEPSNEDSSTEENTTTEDTDDENDSTEDSTVENSAPDDSANKEPSDEDESTEEPPVVEKVEGSVKWIEINPDVNGKSLVLPCSYETICDVTGLLMTTEDTELMLEPGATEYVHLYDPTFDYSEEYRQHAMMIVVYNPTGEAMKATDCLVIEVEQLIYDPSFGAPTITFPGGIKVYDELTLEQAIALFGTPDEIIDRSDPDGVYVAYDYVFRDGNSVLWISTSSDQISSITIRIMD